MFDAILQANLGFQTFGLEHFMTILFSAIAGTLIIWYAKNRCAPTQQHNILKGFGWAISAIVVLWTLLEVYTNNFDKKEDLPFLICNFMAFALPIYTQTKSKAIFNITYFWVMGWTAMAIVTPDLEDSFPHYHFIKFFAVHIGLVFVILYSIFVFGYRPAAKHIWQSVIGMGIYLAVIVLINALLGANYFYLNHKPQVATAIDWFGDWPYYIPKIILLLVPVFSLLYLPFWRPKR